MSASVAAMRSSTAQKVCLIFSLTARISRASKALMSAYRIYELTADDHVAASANDCRLPLTILVAIEKANSGSGIGSLRYGRSQPVRDPHAADRRAAVMAFADILPPNRWYWFPNAWKPPGVLSSSGDRDHEARPRRQRGDTALSPAMRGQADAVSALSCRARIALCPQTPFDNKVAIGDCHRLRHGSNYPEQILPESHSMVHIRRGLHWRAGKFAPNCGVRCQSISFANISTVPQLLCSHRHAAPPALAASDPRCAVPQNFFIRVAEHRDNDQICTIGIKSGKLMPRSAPTQVSITLQMVGIKEKAEYRSAAVNE